ncbi:centrosome and spindle pole associated protein 1-like isoform X4 [Patiria miniata]|uniref:Centrosome and spindle pole-associated protein 1 C-terminal domain-containing protein n=1 Tax=Patiria miniata TaxID=46514 RepID=A0A913ZZZ2_PATMI|nr:centrosome and spindle pole associated protein 1-like isoform X4 [Patiria miniata]
MAEDIDRFIQEQKRQLARERNELQQESARKVLEPASSNNPGPGINGFKENIPPSDKGVALETSKALPVGSHDNLRNKLAKERHDEYQRFLEEKEKRSGTRSQPQAAVDGGSLNIPSRDSAKDRSRVARNKEYNEFLKNKGGSTSRKPRVGNDELSPGITHRGAAINPITGDPVAAAKPSPPAQPNSHPPSDLRAAAPPQDRFADIQTRREAASQTPRPILRDYDDRPPPGPPGGPRRGWGTPNPDYDEILRRKREEEARYRRYDDDLDYYQPRGGIRPSYSDPHLNRYPPEDGRYSRARNDYYDQEYDRRRVRFSDERNPNDRGYPPPSNVRYDRPPANRAPGDGRDVLSEPLAYDWNISRGGRSRTLPEMERQRSNVSRADDNTDSRPPRAKSATLSNDEVGIAIGNRDTASATRRKKDQYRKELEQQMKEAQEAKKREKQEGLRINATGANDPAKKAQGFGGYASSRGPSRTPVPNQQPPAQAPPPQQQAGNQPARYQPSFRNQAYPTGQGPPGPALGLEEAISRSRLGDAPMIERPFSLNTYQPPLNATSTDPYMYYGVRNPLDPDPDNIRTARTWIDSMSRSLSRTGGAIVGKDGDTFSAFMTDVEIAEANLVNQGVPRQPQTPRQQPAGVLTRYDGHQVQQPLTPRQGRRQTQNASQLSSPFATNEELENPPPVQNTITGRRTPRQHNQPKTVLKPPTITGVISGGAGPQQAKGKVSFTLPDPSELPHRGYDQLTQATRQFQQTYNRAAKAGVPVNNAPQENLSLLNASKTAQIRGESSIKNFVGDTTLSPRSLNDPKSYQAILKQQMEEKERKKRIEKEEQERYDAKLEAQAAEYNPWGKGGGGAPMRDNKGKIVADLRQLHQHNEQALNDPASTQLQLYADQPLAGNTTTTAAAVTADRSPRPGATEPQPVTSASKDPKDEYKEYLKQQVEDKKRREAALKEKIRLEEEKEERRLEQQRIKMQRDFEVEQQRMKDKEEEKVRQAQELERKIEEQKKEAEKKKHDVIEARRREGEEDRRKQEQAKNEQKERYSPPIPALRNKENQNPPRQSSPPIPTLRKKKEEEKKDSPRAANKIHGTPRQPPGSQREMDARPIKPAKADIYNRPYSKEKPSALDNPKTKDSPQTRDNPNANPNSNDNISSPWNELSPSQTPPQEELKREKENPLGNLWEYSQGPTGKTSEERARIFPDKEIPEKHAQLEALDKFRLPPESPSKSPLPRVISKENAALSPMEKLHTHKLREGDEAGDGRQGKDVQESQGKPLENPGKSTEFDLVDWLRSVDPDLVVYAPALAENGYKTEKTVRRMSRHTLLQFCPDMKHGHVEALLHEVDRIQTPATKKLLEEDRIRNNRGSWSEHAKVLAPNPRQKEPKNKPRIESPPGDTFTDFLIDVSKESDMYKKAVNIAEEHLLHVQQEQEGTSKDGPDGAGRDPRDVMTALSAMRRQLHSEQRRIQSQLDRNKEHDPYSGHKLSSRRASPQVDVFEVARHKAPVAVRREPLTHHAAAAEFSSLKNRESNSRLRLREQFPDQPSSDLTLEAQQRALLRHQQEKLDNLRRGAKSKRPLEEQMPSMDLRDLGRNDSPLLALESESAFIGINNGVADIPNTPPHRKKPPSPRRDYGEPSTSVAKPKDPLGSTMSFDNDTIDYLAQKNKDRNKALRQLEDNTSLVDPDDVLQRFMMRDSHDRPKSGKSEDLSLWLQPTVSDY